MPLLALLLMSKLLPSPLWVFHRNVVPRASTCVYYSGHGLAPGVKDNHSWLGNRLSPRQKIAGQTKLSYADYTISSHYGWCCSEGQNRSATKEHDRGL